MPISFKANVPFKAPEFNPKDAAADNSLNFQVPHPQSKPDEPKLEII